MAETNEFQVITKLMDAFKVYIPHIQNYGISPAIIEQLIKDHEPIKDQIERLNARYDQSKDGVPIFSRPMDSSNSLEKAVNNQLNNAFDSDIVDTKIGYFLGHPINITVEKDKVAKYETLTEAIDQLTARDNLADKNMSFGKYKAIGGYAARLAYIDVEGDKPIARITNIRPEEVIFLYKESISEPTYSLHYYPSVRLNEKGEKEDIQVADFYEGTTYTRYVKTDGDYVPEYKNIHGFLYNPLFGAENNDEKTGEMQKVLNLVDAFNRTISDASNEIEASRLAMLILSNLALDEKELAKMKQSGVLEIYGDNSAATYLTKNVNDTIIENHLNRLDKMILRFTKSVDFSDESFASNLSGVAIKFKTMALEHKSIIAENKMRSMLRYQMKVLCSAWSLLGICEPDDYLHIWFAFKRNLPSNKKDEAEVMNLLQGILSEETIISMASDVDDVEAEQKAKRKDEERIRAQLGDLSLEPNEPTEPEVE